MLDKDQYNQEEYNNYYKQESAGAEIKSYDSDEGSLKSKLIIFLSLVALAVAGYFGFKMFNTDKTAVTKEKMVVTEESQKNEPVAVETDTTPQVESPISNTETINAAAEVVEKKIEKTIKEEVASQVQETIEANKNMSDKDIGKIVALVMNKIEKDKPEESKNNTEDNRLINALQKTDVDTTSTKKVTPVVTNTNSVVQEKKENSNSYNKVTVKATSSDNDLNELSDQIRKLLNMAGEPMPTQKSTTPMVSSTTKNDDNANYAASISKEIETRSKEMRIIVVKPGDTLNKIAKRAYGNSKSYQKIFDANPDILNRADRIYVGQKLRIPE
jgi:nucleoid-associated protein YgaU